MVFYSEIGWPDEDTGEYHPRGYYFWDESGAHSYGPYETENDAQEAMTFYARMYLGLQD